MKKKTDLSPSAEEYESFVVCDGDGVPAKNNDEMAFCCSSRNQLIIAYRLRGFVGLSLKGGTGNRGMGNMEERGILQGITGNIEEYRRTKEYGGM